MRDKIESWLQPLRRHRERLASLSPRLLVIQLGGPVGNRAELGERAEAVAARLAARLGLGNAPCWHTARDNIVEFGAVLALIAGALGKIGQDAALLAQSENGALKIEGGGASSAMAHKANPVTAELLVALARYTAGLSGTLRQALVHENERSGAAWALEWFTLPPLAMATGAALREAIAPDFPAAVPARVMARITGTARALRAPQNALAGDDECGGAQGDLVLLGRVADLAKAPIMILSRRTLISSSVQKKLEKSCTHSK